MAGPALAVVITFSAQPTVAQEPVQAVLSGQLLLAGVPADSGTVVLHWIGEFETQPIDSISVGPEGRFSFDLPNMPAPEADAYWLSSYYDGVLYFSLPPVMAPAQLDSLHIVEAFPSVPAPAQGLQLPIWLREITLTEGPLGWTITDVFVLESSAEVTFEPNGPEGAVWSYPTPERVVGPRVVPGEMFPVPGPVRFSAGRIEAANSVVPGQNNYVFQYDLDALPLVIPMPGVVSNANVFLPEPGPAVTVDGLAAFGPMPFEGGATFRVWSGADLRDQTIRVTLGEESSQRMTVWFAAALAILLVAAGTWVTRRGVLAGGGTPGSPPGHAGRRSRRDILVEVARLDEAFVGGDADPEAGERYRHRRAELLGELEGTGPPGSPR